MNQDHDRITPMLAKIQKTIDEKVAAGKLTKAQLNKLSKNLDVDFIDYVAYQDLKSQAFAGGKLSLAEANMIYGWLGNTPDQFNKQSVAIKTIVTQIIGELLAPRVGV